jgi:hypothetical protein
MTDSNLDRVEEDGYGLVVPFIVCRTQGGTLDDEAFVAGFQAGQIDQALAAGKAVNAATVCFPLVRSDLFGQLELIAMDRGYPYVNATAVDGHPQWSELCFSTVGPETPTEP